MGSSTEEADGTINICAHGRESATLLCYGCYKAPDAEGGHVETVWYCSANCQKADWKFHKHDCRRAQARRSLYRVGETANLAFFRFVERTFDLHIVGVEDRGNVLYIHQGPQDRSTFNQFPSEHLKSDQDKQAAMARMKCRASEEYVQILVEDMLQGMPFEIAEVQIIKVKYLRRVVVIKPDGHQSDSSQPEHVIFKITINENEEYALDVAGAQFGFHNPLTPWPSYLQTRIQKVGRIRPLKPLRDRPRLPSRGSKQKSRRDAARTPLNDQVLEIIASALESWQEKNGKFPAMLKLRGEEFHKKQGELLDLVDERIRARM